MIDKQNEHKVLIVRCIRMLENAGIMDFNGHASIRIEKNRLLINIGSCQRSAITVEDICIIDFDGNVIEGKGKPPLEFHLHTGIYKNRMDVDAIIHCHPKWSTVLTTAGSPYFPVYAQGTLLHPLPILDSPSSINNPEMARQLVKTLDNRPAALMKAHGAVTTGKTIIDAFVLLNYLEENAQRQYLSQQIGVPYSFNAKEIAESQQKLSSKTLFKRTWDHFSAKLDAATS